MRERKMGSEQGRKRQSERERKGGHRQGKTGRVRERGGSKRDKEYV